MENTSEKSHPKWWGWGDLNGFFGLMLDNVTNLVLLNSILVGGFGFPTEIVLKKMIPATALGVFIGDLIYTWMGINLARKTRRGDVTAMPLGLDTPSTIGIAVAVIGPAYLASGNAMVAWHIGMITVIFMGFVKIIFSFAGSWIQKNFPRAGLLGSIGGVGLVLLGFLPLIEIFKTPIVGIVSFGIIIYTLIAKINLPGKIPGAFAAVAAGTIIHHIGGGLNLIEGYGHIKLHLWFSPPLPQTEWWGNIQQAVKYLPIAIPFGLLTIIGGINVTESARCAGDNFNTRNILLTEAFATLIAGVFGGVAQSTPYIGHPAYKSMGARSGYTLLTGLFLGIGAALGIVSAFVDILPVAAVCPILIFVGIEIVSQSFTAVEKKHLPAVIISYLPSIASLILIYFDKFAQLFSATTNCWSAPTEFNSTHTTMKLLGHGFILTAMLWGGVVVSIIDRNTIKCGIILSICCLLCLTGFIHSPMDFGELFLPWNIPDSSVIRISLCYGIMGGLCIIAGLVKKGKKK